MSDEESHSESYYPNNEVEAKTEQNDVSKVIPHEKKISVTVKRNYKSLFIVK